MGRDTNISWTDHTFNIAWGCTKISPGCKNCYADQYSRRYGHNVWGPNAERRTFGEKHWCEPLKWNKEAEREGRRHRVFCSSMCDICEDHPTIIEEVKKLWLLIRVTPFLDWQLLTKRPERYSEILPDNWVNVERLYHNVWLGTSIESMDYSARADELRWIPNATRFISYEPALGPLDFIDLTGIHWVIYGGESGPNFRPHDPHWARSMKRKCDAAGVAFFFKQSPGLRPGTGVELDGQILQSFPEV